MPGPERSPAGPTHRTLAMLLTPAPGSCLSAYVPEIDSEIYAHLRALAGRIHAERVGRQDTLQPTGLLHEAWMKVARSPSGFNDRVHFLAVAARAMRQITVDRARRRNALRRGGGAAHLTLSGVGDDPAEQLDILALDQALDLLERINERAAHVVMLRTFGGMTVEEVAQALDLSTGTIKRAWRYGRAFVASQLEGD